MWIVRPLDCHAPEKSHCEIIESDFPKILWMKKFLEQKLVGHLRSGKRSRVGGSQPDSQPDSQPPRQTDASRREMR